MPGVRHSNPLLFRHVRNFQRPSRLWGSPRCGLVCSVSSRLLSMAMNRRIAALSTCTLGERFSARTHFSTVCCTNRKTSFCEPRVAKVLRFREKAEAHSPSMNNSTSCTCGRHVKDEKTTRRSAFSGGLLFKPVALLPGNRTVLDSLQLRYVRTGFFRSDPDFIDPEDVLFAEPTEEWSHADGAGGLTEAVLERSNVGMGMCILNRGSLDSETVFGLYRRLRDLEVNNLKRFCCVTSRRRSLVSTGLSYPNLLAFAEATQKSRGCRLPASALWYFHNAWELHAVVHSYSKPLLVLLNGRAEGEGGALCFLANRSAAYTHSVFSCDTTSIGFTPTLGLSFALGRLRGSLGAFLALTGHELKGQDLIWSGLCKYWVSPEALHFMELTAEKQLEVSEQDAKGLLEEHFLEPPQSYSLDMWEEIIDEHFRHSTREGVLSVQLEDVLHALDASASGRSSSAQKSSSIPPKRVAAWAAAVAARIRQRSPLACKLTLELLRRQKQLQQDILEDANITPYEWRKIKSLESTLPSNVQDDSMKQILEAVDEQLLANALENEMRVALRLISSSKDLVEGLRARLLEDAPDLYTPPQWTDVSDVSLDAFFDPLPSPSAAALDSSNSTPQMSVCKDPFGLFRSSDFRAEDRSLFPLSAHPLVARLTPGGGGGGLSERQQARLNARWNWDLFQKLLKQEGF